MAYGFDVDRLLVWLVPRDPEGDPLRAGSLCKRHADAMVVPRGWTLDDRRELTPRLFRTAPLTDETDPQPRPARTRSRPGRDDTPVQLPLTDIADHVERKERAARAAHEASSVGAAATVAPDANIDVDPVVDVDEESRTVANVTGEPLANDDPDATVAIPWLPSLDDPDDLDGVLAAKSPLLARAFRGTDRPR